MRGQKFETRLNLGCGKRIMPNFINIDIQDFRGAVIGDATKLDYSDHSVDLIYACHILEHFKRDKILDVLKEWYRVLKLGGKLQVAVPNFPAVVDVYQKYGFIMNTLCGGQRDEYDIHYIMFDEALLGAYLKVAGFKNIHRYDWRQTDHADFDDYSQAYYPHMDKESGINISLNMEGTK